ncbi:hypothetical protein TIFTF001_052539 [Ficus carica]|uniref:Uncharacterized protein n=1 Tax=Ficus carica TaxID=3494 RepID=A0AA88JHP0_FICCA|nr:hypothetical protein TIFTF001_052539 [Ficus carica]
MPGNFDGRLFPDYFLHFAHSCYSLQWRSRPQCLGIIRNHAIYDMVQEGLIEEKKLDSFNLPYYAAAPEEVRHGNKSLKSEKHGRGNHVAMSIRVVVQSVLASHFGDEIMDNMFDKYAIKVEECLKVEKGKIHMSHATRVSPSRAQHSTASRILLSHNPLSRF